MDKNTSKIDTNVSGGEVLGNKKDDKSSFVIEKIVDHRKRDGVFDYLVKWKDYGIKDNTWVPVEDFDGLAMIHKYWKGKERINRAKEMPTTNRRNQPRAAGNRNN